MHFMGRQKQRALEENKRYGTSHVIDERSDTGVQGGTPARNTDDNGILLFLLQSLLLFVAD